MGGMNSFAPFLKRNGSFIVKNVTSDRQKTIKIFNYPILYNQTRDLLMIPGVSESDIRASLLKGELLYKILAQDIVITSSDIDLLQFNDDQRTFLENAGVTSGLIITADQGGGSGGNVDSTEFLVETTTTTAEIQAAANDGYGLVFARGTHVLTDTITLPRIGARVRGLAGNLITASWTDTADDAANAMFYTTGAAVSGGVSGVTSANGYMGLRTITASVSAPLGSYVRISGNNPDDIDSLSGTIMVTEVAKVVSVTGSAPNFVHTLDRALAQYHSSGVSFTQWNPVLDIKVEDINLSATGVVGCGISIQGGAIEINVNRIEGGGFARSVVDFGLGARDIKCADHLGTGGNNALINGDSYCDFVIERIKNSEIGDRVHASGTVRGLISMRWKCTNGIVRNCDLNNGFCGILQFGGNNITFDNITFRDFVLDVATGLRHPEIGTNMAVFYVGPTSVGPTGAAECANFCRYTNITWINWYHTSDVNNYSSAFYCHDTFRASAANLRFINGGQGSSGNRWVIGMVLSDSFVHFAGTCQFVGCYKSIHTRQTSRGIFDHMVVDGLVSPGGGFGSGTIYMSAGATNSSIQIKELHWSNGGGFELDPDYGPDWLFRIEHLDFDGKIFKSIKIAYVDSGTPVTGEIWEYDPTYENVGRRIRPYTGGTPVGIVSYYPPIAFISDDPRTGLAADADYFGPAEPLTGVSKRFTV